METKFVYQTSQLLFCLDWLQNLTYEGGGLGMHVYAWFSWFCRGKAFFRKLLSFLFFFRNLVETHPFVFLLFLLNQAKFQEHPTAFVNSSPHRFKIGSSIGVFFDDLCANIFELNRLTTFYQQIFDFSCQMLQSLVALAFPLLQSYWYIAVETFPVVGCLGFFNDKATSLKDI